MSSHRNLVTQSGLRQIERELAEGREALASAESDGDRERVALAFRDLRYWQARRETAELSIPEPGGDVVRFGMNVAVEDEDGKGSRWTIVGEDEADPSTGKISHVSPMAVALFGRKVGDEVTVNGRAWEVVALG